MTKGEGGMIEGPSGTGKSSLIRSALHELGSGVVLSAPAGDELASYEVFKDNELIQMHAMESIKDSRSWLQERLLENGEHLKQHGEPLYKVLAYDTGSGMDQIMRHALLDNKGLDFPPKARSEDGAYYYQGIQTLWERYLRLGRAFREQGTHWLLTCHTKKKPGS